MNAFEHEIDFALRAARRAAGLIMEVYASDFAVEWKGHNDPVTEADRRANELLCEAIEREFPRDGICSEEGDLTRASDDAARGGRCWFVDPIDGTKEFVDRRGEFCVMMGLAVDGRAAMGVVVAPVWGRSFVGVPGHGAWELSDEGIRKELHASAIDDPTKATIAVSRSHPHARVDAMIATLGVTSTRVCGSLGLKVSLVAAGEVHAYAHMGRGPKLWDGCAPEAIALAAGCEVTDASGSALRYDTRALALDAGIVVAPAPLAARVRGAL